MKPTFFWIYLLCLVLLEACVQGEQQEQQTATTTDSGNADEIYYTSLNFAVNQGQYDGVITLQELKKKGSLGVGSTAQLQYELVIAGDTAYGIPASGKAIILDDTTKVAYAAVKDFQADTTFAIKTAMSMQAFEEHLSSIIDENAFTAIRIEGNFSSIKYRSFAIQTKPYQPTDQIPEQVFNKENMQAIFSGFYTPKSAQVLNSPVYHFHFVDQAKETGGHVHDYTVEKANVSIDFARDLHVHLPDTSTLESVNLNQPVGE